MLCYSQIKCIFVPANFLSANIIKMFETLIISAIILGISLLLLAIRLVLGKRTFVNTHVEGNPHMEAHGITCAKSQHKKAQANATHFVIKEH